MSRFIGVLGFLVIFVVTLVWAASKSQEVSSTATIAEVRLNSALVNQAEIDTSTANAQQTATADILQAHDRATFSAATATENAGQTQAVLQQTQVLIQATQAMLQQTQIQFSQQLTADSATAIAGATATQQQKNENGVSTTTAIAGVIATQTQSFISTQQGQAEQVRQNEADQQEMIVSLWIWGPPLFLLVVVAVGVWLFWYWEIHKRVRLRSIREQIEPAIVDPIPSFLKLPLPEVVIDPDPITEPDGEMSGWLEEVKEKILASDKEDHVNPKT